MNRLMERSARGDISVGVFLKSNSHQIVEILGLTGLDFIVIDAEHAPFGPRDLDLLIMAARSRGLPAIVRVPDATSAAIGTCLDLGADGVLVPHVLNGKSAESIRSRAKFIGGSRGLSPSPRSGDYGGIGAFDYARKADAETTLWCQVEDREAVASATDIAGVDGVDCLFIGPVDLAHSLGETSVKAPAVAAAVDEVCSAGRRAGKAVAMFVSSPSDIPQLAERGVTVFVVGSDQGLLRSAATDLVRSARAAASGAGAGKPT